MPVRTASWRFGCAAVFLAATLAIFLPSLQADLPAPVRDLLAEGKYEEAAELASERAQRAEDKTGWMLGHAEALNRMGLVNEAAETASMALTRQPNSPSIRFFLYELISRFQPQYAAQRLLHPLVRQRDQELDPQDQTAIGEALLALGSDPRAVLDDFLRPANKEAPDLLRPYLAIGNLALDKQDYQLAAETFRQGLRKHPDHPDLLFGLGSAVVSSSPDAAGEFIERALEKNPRHAPGLLWLARRQIDQRDYPAATETLEKVTATDPTDAEAWALRAVIAEMQNRPEEAEAMRSRALRNWDENPLVDAVIGTELVRGYRFDEGIAALQEALAIDSTFVPARLQLGTALLRQGRDDEGWPHIEYVRLRDPYNIVAFNLLQLRDRLNEFVVLEGDGIRLRMDEREAAIYGPRALAILEDAKAVMTAKYDIELPYEVLVEIFAKQSDFAIRTFAMPGGEGFLGVCFGPLITAASPGGRLGRANWEAVLWHEFGHTITLALTRHRIPRWLSEGISVHEEHAHNPAWGFKMNPAIRRRILEGEAPKLTEMDALFRQPDMPFAYTYSSLIVDALVEEYGFDSLRQLLVELRTGKPINAALAAVYGDLDALQEATAGYARLQAEAYGSEFDWTYPEGDKLSELAAEPEKWLEENPGNLWGMLESARAAAREGNWERVRELTEPIVASGLLIPGDANPHGLLAAAHRARGETDREKETLQQLVARNADALSANVRLLELAEAEEDAAAAAEYADRILAIDPLNLQAHASRARALAASDRPAEAIDNYRALLRLNPPDKSRVHYELAVLLAKDQPEEALQQVLRALELSPRYRAAYPLLLELNETVNRNTEA